MTVLEVSAKPKPTYDWLVAPVLEGFLILVVGVIGLFAKNPFVFSSLGATAFEQIEKSRSKSARAYNVLVGHASGVLAGFAAVAVLRVWNDPVVLSSHKLSAGRVGAAVLAVLLTVVMNQLLRATQPAACSTSLLVALGSFSNWHQTLSLIGGVVILTTVGEPLRRLRLRTTEPQTLH